MGYPVAGHSMMDNIVNLTDFHSRDVESCTSYHFKYSPYISNNCFQLPGLPKLYDRYISTES